MMPFREVLSHGSVSCAPKMITSRANLWTGYMVLLLWAVVESEPVVSTPNEQTLNRLLSFIDNQTDPCDNFYKYVGGNYCKHWNFLSEVEVKVRERFKSIFETLNAGTSLDASSVAAKVLNFYQTCRTATNESRSLKHYLELVPPGSGIVWPHFNSSHQSGHTYPTLYQVKEHPYPFDWMTTLARLRRYGLNNVLFKMNITLDPADSSKYVVMIDKANLERKRDGWDTADILRKVGMTSEVGIWESHINYLEETLSKLGAVEDEPMKELTLGELEFRTGWPWRQYFEIVFARTFSSDYSVKVLNMEYFVDLKRLLGRRHSEIFATYIMARFAYFLDASTTKNEALDCVKDVRDHMDFGCALLFESHYLGPEKFGQYEADMQKLFNELRTRLLARIDANNLELNLSQRTQLKQMLEAMKLNVGNFPKNLDHRSFVNNFYRDLQLEPGQDFAAVHLKALEVRTRRLLERLDKPREMIKGNAYYFLEEGRPIVSADPWFVNRENTVVLPLDILQEPFYIPESHDVFKVSLLGFMLGRQMARSLQPEALIYDGDGNPSDQLRYLDSNHNYKWAVFMLSKFTDDYKEQTVDDVTGLKLTHDVYFGVGAKYSQEQPSFTNIPLQRLFFLNLAQSLISHEDFVDFNGRQTDELRLNIAVASLFPFGEAFNCSEGTAMHCLCGPYVECNAW